MSTGICRYTLPNCSATEFEQVRTLLQPGDILLSRKRGWLSNLTSWGMNSVWTHVGMVVKLPEVDRWMVLEGSISGVRLVPLRYYVSHYAGQHGKMYPGTVCLIRSVGLEDPKQRQAKDLHVLRQALDKLGAPYDWREISRIIGRWARRGLGLAVATHYAPDHNYICSEFTRDMLADYAVHLPLNDNGTIVPGDFADATYFRLIAVIQVLAEATTASTVSE